MTRSTLAGLFLVGISLLAPGCGGSAATPRGPAATIAIPAAEERARLPEPVVEVHAGATLDIDVTLAAGDPRRTLTVWLAEPRYLDALGELCQALHAPPDGEERQSGAEEAAYEATVAAWRAEEMEKLAATCAGGGFVRSVVTLEGKGEHVHASIAWNGQLRLGGRSVESLHVATVVAEQPSTRMPVPAHDVAIEGKPILLGDERFAPDHALDDLFGVGVLLPTADGHYARSEVAESSFSPMLLPIATGWGEASMVRASLGALTVRAHGDRMILAWAGHRGTLDMSTIAQRMGIADVKLEAVDERGGKIFGLLAVSTWTRGRPTGGFCGAGSEEDLVAVELGESVGEVRSEAMESCQRTVSSESISKPGSKVLVFRRTDFSNNSQTDCVKYDRAHPEKGLVTFACKAPKSP